MKSELEFIIENNLYAKVKAGFLLQGTSLHRWCIDNDVKRQNAAQALKGLWKGPKSQELCERLVNAAHINVAISSLDKEL